LRHQHGITKDNAALTIRRQTPPSGIDIRFLDASLRRYSQLTDTFAVINNSLAGIGTVECPFHKRFSVYLNYPDIGNEYGG
jgi:hypothetical protein